MIIYRVTAAIALILEISEMCNLHLLPNGPFGGSSLAQLGTLFGIAFVTTELRDGLVQFASAARRLLVSLFHSARQLKAELRKPDGKERKGN